MAISLQGKQNQTTTTTTNKNVMKSKTFLFFGLTILWMLVFVFVYRCELLISCSSDVSTTTASNSNNRVFDYPTFLNSITGGLEHALQQSPDKEGKESRNPFQEILKGNLTGDGSIISPSLKTLFEALANQSQSTTDDVEDDENSLPIDHYVEAQRCARYGYTYDNTTTSRKRIFWGSLIADDSWHILSLAAFEYHGIFESIALVESNSTQTLSNRDIRFPANSTNLDMLTSKQLWGPKTSVNVAYYYDPPGEKGRGLYRENLQRQRIFELWKQAGMTEHDIGFLSDIDEVATRDFLRALQVCAIPQFNRPNRCVNPKLQGSTLVFEGSPMCLQGRRRWYHPDFVTGECVDMIGDATRHPPIDRKMKYGALMRYPNWKNDFLQNKTLQGPLWDPTDFRMEGGSTARGKNGLHTAFHLHNFFASIPVLRNKYVTYGHPVRDAGSKPLAAVHSGDVGFMVDCLAGRNTSGSDHPQTKGGYQTIPSGHWPRAFQLVSDYPRLRHEEFQNELKEDEKVHGRIG